MGARGGAAYPWRAAFDGAFRLGRPAREAEAPAAGAAPPADRIAGPSHPAAGRFFMAAAALARAGEAIARRGAAQGGGAAGDPFALSPAALQRLVRGGLAGAPEALSVVIVTRARPRPLARALAALSLQTLPGFELILVGDAPAEAACPAAARLLRLPCPEANIARARNIGAAAATGAVLAFLDDDSVPEPDWLSRLTAPFADPQVALVAGRVRGWTGLKDEAPFALMDGEARIHRLASAAAAAAATPPGGWLHAPRRAGPGRAEMALSPVGASHAVRAADLRAVGGYDEAFRYHLDESDLALRLAAAGRGAAYAPHAQAQHLRAASAVRRADRGPAGLFEIGASTAHFLGRHAPERAGPALARLRAERRRALDAALLAGRVEPGRMRALAAEFDRGAEEGARRAARLPLTPAARSRRAASDPACRNPATSLFAPAILPRGHAPLRGTGLVLHGPSRDRAALAALAGALAAKGAAATLLDLSPGLRPLRLRAEDAGWRRVTGGFWGRAEPSGPLLRPRPRAVRLAEEIARTARRRAAAVAMLHRGTLAEFALFSDMDAESPVEATALWIEILAASPARLRRNYVVVPCARLLHAASRNSAEERSRRPVPPPAPG